MTKLIGKKVGKLEVISLDRKEQYLRSDGKTGLIYFLNCICDCGNHTVVRSGQLGGKKPKTQSCGCARSDSNKSRTLDLSGKTFSKLTAVEKTETGEWLCKCSCGNYTTVSTDNLNSGNTKSCGCLQKERASSSMLKMLKRRRRELGKPEDEPMSSDYKLLRSKFSEIALEVLKRDNYSCLWCSSVGEKLNVHHIQPWAANEALRFDKRNLVTLCKSCHFTVHNHNFHTEPNAVMSILLQGYCNEVEEAWAAKISATPN